MRCANGECNIEVDGIQRGIGWVRVIRNKTGEVREIKPIQDLKVIDNDYITLEYLSYSQDKGGLRFKITSGNKTINHLTLDILYYQSYQGFNHTAGGASVFRPKNGQSPTPLCLGGPTQLSTT